VRIVELARSGLTDKEIAGQTEWSQSTVRKWRRRDLRSGRAALASTIGRPRRGALSSYPAEVRETLRWWRETHPGWGPKTLHAELVTHPVFAGQAVPSRASIARYLKEQGLTRPYERHSDLPEPERQAADKPHAVWEMDARGHTRVPDVGVITLININDRHTHLRLLSYPVWLGHKRRQRHSDTEDYQTALRLAFTDWGLPERLQVDRASVFVDNATKSPFPTRLHLWLVALGVTLTFGRPGQPRDQAMTERSHQLWAAQCLQGQRYPTWTDLYLALRRRRDFLNSCLPCAPLDEQPPLQVFPQATHSQRPYRPEWEPSLLDLSRIYDYLAQGRWFRLACEVSTFSLGGQIYYLGTQWARHQLDIAFDPTDQHLVCSDEAGRLIKRLPIQGLTVEHLMGDVAAYINLPVFQLCLPFDWDSQRVVRFFETVQA
jgi:transposase